MKIKSLTLEDVLYAHDSPKQGITIGESQLVRHSYRWELVSVYNDKSDGTNERRRVLRRRKIVYESKDLLKTKHYIPLGEECAICFEGIFSARNAFLNECGHGFHYSCIVKSTFYKTSCPICRREDVDIYAACKGINDSLGISKADQIEMNPQLSFPQKCIRKKRPYHYSGMDSKCAFCTSYFGKQNYT